MRRRTLVFGVGIVGGLALSAGCGSSSSTAGSASGGSAGASGRGGSGSGASLGGSGAGKGGTSAGSGGSATSGGSAGASGGEAGVAAGEAGMTGSSGANGSGDAITSVLPAYTRVRQGQASFTIEVDGTELSGASGFDLQGLTIVQVEPGASDTSFTLLVTAPHGVALGPKDLSFSAGGVKLTKAAVVTVTPISAGPSGNDTSNRGSSDNPFRSFKKAMGAAAKGDTVALADGTYDATTGEDWQETLPSGVTLQGDSANTILSGPAGQGATPSTPGLSFAGDAIVKNLTVSYFADGAAVTHAGNITLDSVQFVSNAQNGLELGAPATIHVTGASAFSKNLLNGIKVMDSGATLSLEGTAIDDNKQSGVIFGSAAGSFTMKNGEINRNLMGALFYSVNAGATPLTVALDGTHLWNNGYYSVYAAFGYPSFTFNDVSLKGSVYYQLAAATSAASLSVTNSTIAPPDPGTPGSPQDSFGITFSVGTLTLSKTTISGFSSAQISEASGTVVLRDSTITVTSGGQYGVYIGSGKLDLGTATTAGNNVFVAPKTASSFGLYDNRTSALIPITSNNTTFNGDLPASGTTVTGPASVNGAYHIQGGGQIAFY